MVIKKEIVLIGAGGHARVIIDTAECLGFNISSIIDIGYKGKKETIIGYPVIGNISVLSSYNIDKIEVFIAIGDNKIRTEYFKIIKNMGFNIPVLIHPTAILSNYVSINEGVFVNAGSIINALSEIGKNTIINTGSIIDHEVKIGKNTHICPGVKIAGRVSIGNNTFIGTGTTIIDKIRIGDNVIIGAGSVVIKDVKSNSKVAGVPARELK